jgi:hypothetical protein
LEKVVIFGCFQCCVPPRSASIFYQPAMLFARNALPNRRPSVRMIQYSDNHLRTVNQPRPLAHHCRAGLDRHPCLWGGALREPLWIAGQARNDDIESCHAGPDPASMSLARRSA